MPSTINATSRRVRSGTVSQFSVGGLIGNLYISSAFGFICSISVRVVTVDERSNASAHLLLRTDLHPFRIGYFLYFYTRLFTV